MERFFQERVSPQGDTLRAEKERGPRKEGRKDSGKERRPKLEEVVENQALPNYPQFRHSQYSQAEEAMENPRGIRQEEQEEPEEEPHFVESFRWTRQAPTEKAMIWS